MWLRYLSTIEAHARHPYAIAAWARQQLPDPEIHTDTCEQFTEHPGSGISGSISGHHIRVGKHEFIQIMKRL